MKVRQSRVATLGRFLSAQQNVHAQALSELRSGRKQSHWMWFVFPQLKGLGKSAQSEFYGLDSLAEAAAYLAHPVLGARLRECTRVVNAIENSSAIYIFGSVDALKFHSCMTLFVQCSGADEPFQAALDRYFGGTPDAGTLKILARDSEKVP